MKSEVYSKLKCCVCRVSFNNCTCPEAKEMKAYIDALLESGIGEDDIFYKVAKKFSVDLILDEQVKKNVEGRLIKEAGGKVPQIVLEPTTFDFGQANKKQGKISKNFKLTNKGSSSLIIKKIKTSCLCTAAALKVNRIKSEYFGTKGSPENWQALIKPRQSAELEIVLDLNHKTVKKGSLLREVSVISNDPIHPEVTVKIMADVIE